MEEKSRGGERGGRGFLKGNRKKSLSTVKFAIE